jgi:hypothetical protein
MLCSATGHAQRSRLTVRHDRQACRLGTTARSRGGMPYLLYEMIEEGVREGSRGGNAPALASSLLLAFAVGLLAMVLLESHGADWGQVAQEGMGIVLQGMMGASRLQESGTVTGTARTAQRRSPLPAWQISSGGSGIGSARFEAVPRMAYSKRSNNALLFSETRSRSLPVHESMAIWPRGLWYRHGSQEDVIIRLLAISRHQ